MNKFNLLRRAHVWRVAALVYTLCAALVLALPAHAQDGERTRPLLDTDPDTVALYQALLDLTNPWTVMCVAAHPDDEDGATLTVLRRKYGVHTVSLFSTYGEGGQNAVGPELYEELGAIRARETEEAAIIQGSEPHFLRLRDFGFSKSADEAFRIWGHDEALRRMVLEIRRLRPDIIITNHDTVSGHGHHQATGRLVIEAFDAAADPKRFPEQLSGTVSTWQVRRLFVRAGFEGGTGSRGAEAASKQRDEIVSIDPNERDTVRGTTYAEQALSALQRHASQGPWPTKLPVGGAPPRRYRLARSATSAAPLPSPAETFLSGLSLPQDLSEKVSPLAARAILPVYVANHLRPEGILAGLIMARKAGLFAVPANTDDAPRFRLMSERLDQALALASGVRLKLTPRQDVVVPNSATAFNLNITHNSERELRITRISPQNLQYESRTQPPITLLPDASLDLALVNRTSPGAPVTVPHAEHLYDGRLFGEKFGVSVEFEADGARFTVTTATRVDVAPLVEIESLSPSPMVLTPATIGRPLTFQLRLKSHRDAPFRGMINVSSVANSIAEPGMEITLAANETRYVTIKTGALGNTDARRTARSVLDTLKVMLRRMGSGEPLTERPLELIYSDARVVPNLRVGYVRSFDETLKNALSALGVEATEVKVEDVRAAGTLSRYDTLIVDIRGYQAHPELVSLNARLLEFVSEGGTLIVFYHKTNEWNPDPQQQRGQLAPYPLTLGNSRVTDETARVNFLEPQHALLNFPNRITPEDFSGWIQERGLYYPQTWDEHYSAVLSMNDPGEQPLRGGLLSASFGKGRYIYTSMVWYRQLRAGVPGAYRMLANMLSYGRAPASGPEPETPRRAP